VCFHGIGEPARVLEPGEAPYWISRNAYLDILDVLAEHPDVRISFDDGNASDIEIGLPGLLERGLSATFFVLAGRLDRPGSLSEKDVRALAEHGMGIGSHGMDHRPWRGLDPGTRRRELEDARHVLRQVSGRSVTEAALPLGRYDRELLSHLRGLGYTAVHTSDRRWAREGDWIQPRFSVRTGDTADTVRRTMLGQQSPGRRAERALVGAIKRWR
jgi:peptidoglycan/xylan/chitin deacetylase (PgdA/CDA1 family)